MNLLRLLDQIEKQSSIAIDETAYSYSFNPGSQKSLWARDRARKAEQAMLKAIEQLRAKLAEPEQKQQEAA
jgi:hypothetical protein